MKRRTATAEAEEAFSAPKRRFCSKASLNGPLEQLHARAQDLLETARAQRTATSRAAQERQHEEEAERRELEAVQARHAEAQERRRAAQASLEEARKALEAAHAEVRLANRIAHLTHLDHMEGCPALLCARARLVRSFQEVLGAADDPNTSLLDFANVVRKVKERHKHQVKRLTVGMQDLRSLKLEAGRSQHEVMEEIDTFLDRFVLSRIGIEMLNSQYLSLFQQSTGIADPHCDPCAIARKAARFARKIASEEFPGSIPEVDVTFHGKADARTLPLVPSYLMYILMELLKNSVRAVAEQHQLGSPQAPVPPIVIRVASDESQVVMDIFDRGGGIPFPLQQKVWSYMYSTRRGTRGAVDSEASEATPLAGFGVGLPLSRLYAEYIGGSLQLVSMPNFGTHAFLFLERSDSRKEGMPTYVNWLRKRHLLEELFDIEARKRAAAEIEDYAEALRLKGLAVEVRAKLKEFEAH